MEFLKQFARLFGWKNRQVETLTEITVGTIKVRVWRCADTLAAAKLFDHEQYARVIERICFNSPSDTWPDIIAELPKVACVAIVGASGNGVSVYPDWH